MILLITFSRRVGHIVVVMSYFFHVSNYLKRHSLTFSSLPHLSWLLHVELFILKTKSSNSKTNSRLMGGAKAVISREVVAFCLVGSIKSNFIVCQTMYRYVKTAFSLRSVVVALAVLEATYISCSCVHNTLFEDRVHSSSVFRIRFLSKYMISFNYKE